MSNQPYNDAIDLLGYHLGLCDDQQRRDIEQAIQQQPQLAQTLSRLPQLLAALNSHTVDNPPADLNARIQARIASLHKTIPIGATVTPSPSIDHGTNRDRPFITLRELTGLAAAITLFVGLVVPGYRNARQAAIQAGCANNLRMLGTGMVTYANQFGGQMPYAGPVGPNDYWAKRTQPFNVTSPNARNIYRLVPGHFVDSRVLVCPARPQDVPLGADGVDRMQEFPSPHNMSYATNLMTTPWNRDLLSPDMPLATDRSPLVDENGILVVNAPANSHVHSAGGQNVLYNQINVTFTRTPNVGVEHDDIYRVYGVQQYTGQERPRLRSDAFLVP